MIFTRADSGSIRIAWDCLQSFGDMSGLKVNLLKSMIFVAGVEGQERELLLREVGIPQGVLPVRYLSIPLSAGSLKCSQYSPLLNSIRDKISLWQPNSLSYAGRLELVRSVLQGVQAFWLSILPIPQAVHKTLIALCRNFFWNHHTPMVAWKEITMPKKEGGLGIRDTKPWNSSLLTSYIWDIQSEKDSLWRKWVHHRYLGSCSFWNLHHKSNMSAFFRKLLQTRDLLLSKLGSPEAVRLFLDSCTSFETFSTAKAYEFFRRKKEPVPWHKTVWCSSIPPKYAIRLWLIMKDKLRTKDKLQFLGIGDACPFGCTNTESAAHLFFQCGFSAEVWRSIRTWCGIETRSLSISSIMSWYKQNVKGNILKGNVRRIALAATVYFIWESRNKILFQDAQRHQVDISFVVSRIQSHVYRIIFCPVPRRLLSLDS